MLERCSGISAVFGDLVFRLFPVRRAIASHSVTCSSQSSGYEAVVVRALKNRLLIDFRQHGLLQEFCLICRVIVFRRNLVAGAGFEPAAFRL